MRRNSYISVSCQKTEHQFYRRWRWPDVYVSKSDDSRTKDCTVAVSLRWRSATIAVTGSVQHSTVSALRNYDRSKSFKTITLLIYRHSKYLFCGNGNGKKAACSVAATMFYTELYISV